MAEPERPPANPTLWQRFKNGVSHAIGYIPRGILLTGVVFATSAALGHFHMDFLGISSIPAADMLPKFVAHLAVGSLISGVLGATLAPCPVCPNENIVTKVATAPFTLSETEKGLGQQITKTAGDKLAELAQHAAADAVMPGSGVALQSLPWLQKNLTNTLSR